MSENFNDKDYAEYFKALEKQVKKEASAPKKTTRKKRRRRKAAVRRAAVLVILILVLGLLALLIFGGKEKTPEPPVSSLPEVSLPADSEEIPVPLPSFEINEQTVSLPQEINTVSGIIVDLENGLVLAEKNANMKLFPASTTKIMTLLVAAEQIKDLDSTFTMTLEITDPLFAVGASVAGFAANETVTLRDLLYGCILPSGADAAIALSHAISGSEEAFVELMNEKVRELGLTGTHFANTTGLHDPENYSTSYDIAIILNEALKNPLCREVLSTYQYTTTKTPQHPEGILISSTLFSLMYGTEPETATILGGKTGFINESGYCLATFGRANESGNEYIMVTLGNISKWPAVFGQIDLYKQFAK